MVPGDADSYQVTVRDSASLILITSGVGKYLASSQVTKKGGLTVVEPFASDDVFSGSVLFLAAGKILEIFPENNQNMIIYQAFCNL